MFAEAARLAKKVLHAHRQGLVRHHWFACHKCCDTSIAPFHYLITVGKSGDCAST
jgi:hypothetical protein